MNAAPAPHDLEPHNSTYALFLETLLLRVLVVQDPSHNRRHGLDVLSPTIAVDDRPIARQGTSQDKVAARRGVLERKAAAKVPEAPHRSPQLDKEDKKRQKQEQAAATKAAKEAEKAEKARQKEAEKAEKAAQKAQEKAAKAAESRGRGKKADQEVAVFLDTSFTKSKAKNAIIDAIESHDVKFSHEVQPGKLPGWSTITWTRNNSSMVRFLSFQRLCCDTF